MPTILVVDDNAVSRELLRFVLRPLGYAFLEAGSGTEALDKIAEARPDIVLLDLEMPPPDGYAVLRKVKQNPDWQDLRVVAVTAYAMQGDRDKALAAGFDGYITKPVNGAELREYVEEILRT